MMPALHPRCLSPRRRDFPRTRESKNEGGVSETWTEGPPIRMASAFYPSKGGGRSWTGVARLRARGSTGADFLGLGQRLGLLAEIDGLDALAATHDLHGRGLDLAQVLLGLREMALEIVDPLLQPPRVAHHQRDQLLDLARLLAHLHVLQDRAHG